MGAGKTTLLKSLATSLSWLVARIRTEKGNGSYLADEDIRNGAIAGVISIMVTDHSQSHLNGSGPESEHPYFLWGIARGRQGRKTAVHSELVNVSRLADHYRTQLTENDKASLPLIAYYPVERSVLEVPLKIKLNTALTSSTDTTTL